MAFDLGVECGDFHAEKACGAALAATSFDKGVANQRGFEVMHLGVEIQFRRRAGNELPLERLDLMKQRER